MNRHALESEFDFVDVYPPKPELTYTCYCCGKPHRKVYADLKGPAFKAYYCIECANEILENRGENKL